MLYLETAMRQMKNNKSPGYDESTTDMIKAALPLRTGWLNQFLRRIWTKNKIPEGWYKAIIVSIYKKGDRKQCENYGRIMLLCQIFKIYKRILATK
jgi:hypothetical protein